MSDINITVGEDSPINVEIGSDQPIDVTVSESTPVNEITVEDAQPINIQVGEETPIQVEILQYTVDSQLKARVELEEGFKVAYSTKYTEFTYAGGDITQIDVWDTAGKGTKLFTKAITYSAGNISQITITDEVTGTILTKTYGYNIGGDIESKTESIA